MPEYDPNEQVQTAESLSQEPALDLELVAKIKAQALIDCGYTVRDDDGQVRASVKMLQASTLQAMVDRHVATSKSDLARRAVTPFELFQELLPHAPGAQSLAANDEGREAQRLLVKDVWGYTNTGVSGFVQKHVAELSLVLCAAEVARHKVNEETGTKEPTLEWARFLTADRDLIMAHYTGPAGASFIRAARRLNQQLGLVAERRPELAVSVAKQLGTVVKQAVSSVPYADTKAVAALQGGTGQDAGAEDA